MRALHLLLVLMCLWSLVTSWPQHRQPYDDALKTPPRLVFRKDPNSQYPRKGEYPCSSGICKLKPGEVPKGCEDGDCQLPLGWD